MYKKKSKTLHVCEKIKGILKTDFISVIMAN